MRILTPATTDPVLAAALGRFSQACNYLERHIEFILIRMLPITTDMGRILISGNQMRRNIEIIGALCPLPEVLSEDDRQRLNGLLQRLRAINDDRSRFLHNPIAETDTGYALTVHKNDGENSTLYPIDVSLIDQRTKEAETLWAELYINQIEYDLSKWALGWDQYQVKPYPKATESSSPRPPAQRKNGRRK